MGLRINNNVAAFNAYRNLSVTDGQMSKSLEKLSSGFRINRAADDAAGLAISEGLRSQVGGLKQAVRNALDGVSVVQTAEGALTEVHSILQRVRDLSVQAANEGANSTTSKAAIQSEITALGSALSDIATRTDFNGTKLLNSTATLTFHVGANATDTTTVSLTDVGAVATAVKGIDVTAAGGGAAGITAVDAQITNVSTARAKLGASQNSLEHTINNLNVAVENLSASESRIRDTDMAQEMVSFTRSQILSQAGTAMLAQANQAPQSVLKLLS
ncbi:MAG: flagellin [Kineosporiaceae bacterium]